MDEILFELRDHSAGLNCGRWDYIFSFIKRFRKRPEMVLPDRAQVTMTTHFLRSYSLLAVKTCHRRGAPAIGGMAAQIPIKDDGVANGLALGKVRADKQREANDGHDGTWVAHPGLVEIARQQFDAVMTTPNQIHRRRDDVLVTAEISRTQVWQWLHNARQLEDGRTITVPLFRDVLAEELQRIEQEVGPTRFHSGKYALATKLFREIIEQHELDEFLTLRAYPYLD
jgi:malate synthase